MKAQNLKTAIVLLVFCLIWGYLTLPLPVDGISNAPGPGFVPRLLVGALTFLSLILLAGCLRPAPVSEGTRNAGRSEWSIVAGVVIPLFLYVWLLNAFGFLYATPVFLLYAFCGLMGVKSWAKALAGAIGTTLVIYLVFVVLLKSNLPAGHLF